MAMVRTREQLLAEIREPRCQKLGISLYPMGDGHFAVARVCLRINEADPEECYDIAVRLSPQYPLAVPTATSEDGSILAGEGGFHVNSDGTLCLGEPSEVERCFRIDPTIAGFLENLVLPFLAKYLLWKQTGVDLGLKHGGDGVLEYFRVQLGELSALALARLLLGQYHKKIGPNSQCPCGSRRKYKLCHMPRMAAIELPRDKKLQNQELVSLLHTIKRDGKKDA